MLTDHSTAPIDAKLKAILTFVEKIVQESTSICPADIELAKRSGVTEEALYDAITVCALFQFYNKWIDASGVQDLPPEGYENSGRRLAEVGYMAGLE